jgi:hypothetical protein
LPDTNTFTTSGDVYFSKEEDYAGLLVDEEEAAMTSADPTSAPIGTANGSVTPGISNANNPNGSGTSSPPVDSLLMPPVDTNQVKNGDPFQYPGGNLPMNKKKQSPATPGKTPGVDPKAVIPVKKEEPRNN